MKFSTLMVVFAIWIPNVSAYEVWMGTHLMRSADANDLPAWALTASQLDGFNSNRAPHDTDPASNDDWRTNRGDFGGIDDVNIRDDLTVVNLGADELVPGRSGSNGGFNRATVFVLDLPDLLRLIISFSPRP